MTQTELIDRLCVVNVLLTDIVREQAGILEQHGIKDESGNLSEKVERATKENDILEVALREWM
jgi:hypothetical protein